MCHMRSKAKFHLPTMVQTPIYPNRKTCATKLLKQVYINVSFSKNTTNVKNMHLHRDSNPGPWNTVPML